MLNDVTGFSKIMIAAGYTDLRRGIEGLATIIVNTQTWVLSHKEIRSVKRIPVD